MTLRGAALLLAAAAALLAGCGGKDRAEDDSAYRGPDGDRPLRLDPPATRPVLPAGVAAYPGARIALHTEIAPEGGERSTLVAMETRDAPAKVIDWYATTTRQAGYRLDPRLATGKVIAVGGRSADGRVFSVSASARDGGTSVQLIAGNAPAPIAPAPMPAAPPLATEPARR